MSGSYYSANPHYAAPDYSEQRERVEAAEETAGRYFVSATKEQHAAFHREMSDLRGLIGPRYDRAAAAATRKFRESTEAARELCEETFAAIMEHGEVPEELSYKWDLLDIANVMQAAE
ncbi:hypothetical protein [Bradyrhizobium sp. OK095]|uniref:hypothetical protein n=1 Tax=Bradyrhizobium sp. OK095 TaxID=1882760 RepID=UPI0008D78B8E|nr:hypothetical protein [Bradyrhizobium sp. OK095]SEN67581.1 hypothetical protein SAMN05443254_11048 [Bradyrhizobium sp. OK095]